MKLVDRVNQFHEMYVFPIANGVVFPWVARTSLEIYKGQIKRAGLKDFNSRSTTMYEEMERDLTRMLCFTGCAMGISLMPMIYQDFEWRMIPVIMLSNGLSYWYHKSRINTNQNANAPNDIFRQNL